MGTQRTGPHMGYRDTVYILSFCKPPRRFAPCRLGPVVVGNVGDNSDSSYRLHASETQQLSYVPMADATPICYLCGVAMEQPSTNDGPTCNTP